MDSSKAITHVSLCAGYGGIDIGLKRAIPNLRTIAFSEIEAFACANLVSKMEAGLLDPAPIWTDLTTFPWEEFRGKVDILSGGYPCQPFSAAGKRQGADDPRHLWPYIATGIIRMQPRVCFFENVEGHITLGLRDVLHDLAGMGYRTTWGIFSASEVGAPHQRKRVFILAHRASQRGEGESLSRWISQGHTNLAYHRSNEAWPSRPGQPQHGWEPPRVVEDTKRIRWRGRYDGDAGGMRGEIQVAGSCNVDAEASGLPNAQDMRLEEQSECLAEREADGSGTSNAWGVRPCEAQEGRPVEHSSHWSNGEQPTEQQGRHSFSGSSEEGAMAHPHGCRGEEPEHQQANLPSEPSGGNAEAMGQPSSQRCEQDTALRGEQQTSRTGEECRIGIAEAMGNTILHGHPSSEITGGSGAGEGEGRVQEPAGGSGAVGNADHGRLASCLNAGSSTEAAGGGESDIEQAESGEIESNVGLHIDESSFGVGDTKLSGLSHQELAEICNWMVASDNRTDELRLLGNGVVPATAERAFRILTEELTNTKGTK